MKKIIVSLVVFLFLSCGTDQYTGEKFNYLIKNDSGRKIKIKSFSTLTANNKQKMWLSNGQYFMKSGDLAPGNSYDYGQFFDGDSIVVIFNNERIIKLNSDSFGENIRNPLDRGFYQDQNETFIFNEEDYNNAEICPGDCE